jgi:hypothetical protein
VMHEMIYIHFQWWCLRCYVRLKRGASIADYFIMLIFGSDAMFNILRFSAKRSCAFLIHHYLLFIFFPSIVFSRNKLWWWLHSSSSWSS